MKSWPGLRCANSWPTTRRSKSPRNAPTAFEAVKAITDLKPDLVLLDVQMPKLDGFEVLELVGSDVAVIFVTAYDAYALRAFDVNAVDYGLTCSIWTQDLATAHRAASRVQAGYVWVNHSSVHFHGAPFGGYKQSGIGREESFDELLEFTQVKNVNVNLG